jgi:hypothetical protein
MWITLPWPGEAKVEFAGLCLRHRDQVFRAFHRHRGIHHHQQRPLRHLHDRRDVGDRIETELVDARVHRVAGGDQHQVVAVGRGPHALLDADDAARAGLVLDDDLGADRRSQLLRHEAADEVRAAAGRERHDDPYRLVRVGLRKGGKDEQRERERQ